MGEAGALMHDEGAISHGLHGLHGLVQHFECPLARALPSCQPMFGCMFGQGDQGWQGAGALEHQAQLNGGQPWAVWSALAAVQNTLSPAPYQPCPALSCPTLPYQPALPPTNQNRPKTEPNGVFQDRDSV